MVPRTPLLRPDRYFARRDVEPVRGLMLTAVLTLAVIVSIWAMGAVFADRIDGTVMVDNPERPPEGFCDNGMNETFEQMNASSLDCSGPAQVEQDVDPIINDAVGQFYGPMLVGFPLLLLFTGLLLHAGTALAGGEGGFTGTLTVAAWGFAPMLVVMPASLVLLWATMDPVTVTPNTDPAVLRETVLGSIEAWRPYALVLNVAGSIWGAVVWTYGLESARSVSRPEAATVAGIVTLLFLVGGLL